MRGTRRANSLATGLFFLRSLAKLVIDPLKYLRIKRSIRRRGETGFASRVRAHRFIDDFLARHDLYADRPGVSAHSSGETCQRPLSNDQFQIWIYWAQGFRSAPEIVSACRRRMSEMNDGARIVEIDDDNIGDYVDIPNYIFRKIFHNKTHFSDILRCSLLARHGGIWCDATCYCAQPLQPLFTRTKDGFFAYTRTDTYLMSSWLMISAPGNPIPVMLRDALLDYWAASTRLEDYFWIHYLFEALYNQHAQFRAIWDARHIECSARAHTLQHCLAESYDQAMMAEILALTPIQKLTYKIPDPPSDSYWHHLLERRKDACSD